MKKIEIYGVQQIKMKLKSAQSWVEVAGTVSSS
jgi:hypothetical protein